MTRKGLFAFLTLLMFAPFGASALIGFACLGDEKTQASGSTEKYLLTRVVVESDGSIGVWPQSFDDIDKLKAAVSKMRGGKERDWDKNVKADDIDPYPILKDVGCQCGEDCACVDCKCQKRGKP